MKFFILTILLTIFNGQVFSQTNSPQSTITINENINKLQVKTDTLPALQLQNKADTLPKAMFNYAVTAITSLEKDGNMNLFKDLTAGLGNASSIEATGSSSVNPYTGKLNVSMPLYTFKSKSINVPIALNYSTDGVNLLEVPSQVGTGWQLSVGGKISRKMNGFPDEEKRDKLLLVGNKIIKAYGYLTLATEGLVINDWDTYTTNQKLAFGHAIAWRTNSLNATKAYDGEPDEFYYNVAGYSGKFVFTQNGGVMQIPQTNVKILPKIKSYTNGATTKNKIYGFDLVAPDGTIYVFGDADLKAVEEKKLTSLGLTIDFRRRAMKNKDVSAVYSLPFPSTYHLNTIPIYTLSLSFITQNCTSNDDSRRRFPLAGSLSNEPHSTGFLADIKSTNDCGPILQSNTFAAFYYEPIEFLYDATPRLNMVNTNPNEWDYQTKYRYEVLHDNYTTDWHLVSIISPDNDKVDFEYEEITTKYLHPRHFSITGPVVPSNVSSLVPVLSHVSNANNDDAIQFFHPTNLQLGTNYVFSEDKKKLLKKITNKFGHFVEFFNTKDRTDLTGGKTLDKLVVSNGNKQVKAWAFNYEYKEAAGNEDKLILAKGNISNASQNKIIDLNDKFYDALQAEEGITKEEIINKYKSYFTTEQSWLFLSSIVEIDNKNAVFIDKYKFQYEYNNKLARRGTITENLFGFMGINKPAAFSAFTNSFEIFYNRPVLAPTQADALKTGVLTSYVNNLGGKVGITYEAIGNSTGGVLRVKELLKYPDLSTTTGVIKETYTYELPFSNGFRCLNDDGRKVTPEKIIDFSVSNLSPNTDPNRPFAGGITGKKEFKVMENNFITGSQPTCILNQTGGGWYGHKRVSISQVNNGKRVIEYITPNDFPDPETTALTFFDCFSLMSSPLNVQNRAGKSISQLELLLLPRTDFEWKRGLVKSETIYNQDEAPLSKTTNTYKYSLDNAPNTVVKGLLCEIFSFPAKKLVSNIVVSRIACNGDCRQKIDFTTQELLECSIEGKPFEYFTGHTYNFESNFPNLDKTLSETFFYEGTTSTISKEITYKYNSKHLQLTKVTESNTNASEVLESITIYPDDLYNFSPIPSNELIKGDPYALIMKSMIDRNMISYPIETINTKGGKVIDAVYNIYDLRPASISNSMVLLTKRYTSKKIVPYLYQDLLSDVETETTFKRAFYNVTIEEGPGGTTSAVPSSTSLYHFGPLLRSSKYFSSPEVEYDYYGNGNLRMMTSKSSNVTTYLWSYKSYLPIAEIQNASFNSVLSSLGGANNLTNLENSITDSYITNAITSLRNNLLLDKVLIKSYTFDPLIGITKSFDHSNMNSKYEYDDFNRLIKVFDNESKLVKSYQYNYKLNTITGVSAAISFSAQLDAKNKQIDLSFAYPSSTVVKYEIRRGQGNEPMTLWATIPGDNTTKIDHNYTPQQSIYNYEIRAILNNGTATEWKSLSLNLPDNCNGKLQLIKNGLILTSTPVHDKACYEILLEEGFETQDNAEYTGEIDN